MYGVPFDHRAGIDLQSASFRLFLGCFQSFLSPDALYLLVIDDPTLIEQQRCDPTIPIAAIFTRQFDDPLPEQLLILRNLFVIALR